MTEIIQREDSTLAPPSAKVAVPSVRAGGALATFIPQTMEELWRMARWAAVGGMAPKSLTEGKDLDGATSAAAIAIMAGAELGLTPMMALRSYAVVNGRPSLWGDGLIAVVLKSSVYKQGSMKRGGDAKMGWCEAERTDGTKWREEFTWVQATTAGLTGKDIYKKFPDVMLQRRAISKCLNFLFADVLGGMVTEDDAYESGGMIDVSPPSPSRPTPPAPPPEDEDQTKTEPTDAADQTTTEPIGPAAVDGFLQRLKDDLANVDEDDEVLRVFDESEPQVALAGRDADIKRAFDLRNLRLGELRMKPAAPVAEQDDTFPGDR